MNRSSLVNPSDIDSCGVITSEKRRRKITRRDLFNGISSIIGGFFILCCVSTMSVGFTNIYEASYIYNNNGNTQAPNLVNFTMSIRGLVTQLAYSICVGLALKLGERTSIFIFSFLNCLNTFLVPFCKNSIILYVLNVGIGQGLFGGIPYFIPVLIGWTYFPMRKGLVTSLIMMGYSMSSYIIGSVIPTVVNPENIDPDEIVNNGKGSIKLYGPEVTKNVPRMWFAIAGINFALLLLGMVFLRRPLLAKNTKKLNIKSSMGRSYIESVCEKKTPKENISALRESLVNERTNAKAYPDFPPLQEVTASIMSIKSIRSQNKSVRGGSRISMRGKQSMSRSVRSGRSFLTRSMSDQQYNFWRRAFFSCDLYPLVFIITTGMQFPMFFATNFMTFANEYNFSSLFSSTVASYASIFMVLGKLMIGPVYDLIGYRWTLNLLLLFEMTITIFTFFFGNKEWGFAIVLFCSFWLYGSHLSIYMVISQRLFGVNNGPKAYSIMAFGLTFSNLIGASAGNVLLAIFGYKFLFFYFFGSTLASLIVFCLYRPKIKKFRETFEEHYDPSKE